MKEITADSLEEAGLLSIKNGAVQKLLFKYLKFPGTQVGDSECGKKSRPE
ncbi:hypothetical protein [Plebeiibacterium marinum]|uniref:Uncharacterized protein n=1 Tax=Plebeiibacterium marinum TaxID=2992111 RepID=A0AAE3MCE4_9BACT|nr:hypothetical protein [Plebeiobacterium marinum]MCW3805183.1 hypothetical protein [Plebeiobacterium marinum]